MSDRAEKDAGIQTLRDAAKWLRGVSEKCCECTDGHHDQRGAYGTESDVHVSRDTARALADWLDREVAWGEIGAANSPMPEAVAAARGVLIGSVLPSAMPTEPTP